MATSKQLIDRPEHGSRDRLFQQKLECIRLESDQFYGEPMLTYALFLLYYYRVALGNFSKSIKHIDHQGSKYLDIVVTVNIYTGIAQDIMNQEI